MLHVLHPGVAMQSPEWALLLCGTSVHTFACFRVSVPKVHLVLEAQSYTTVGLSSKSMPVCIGVARTGVTVASSFKRHYQYGCTPCTELYMPRLIPLDLVLR